MIDSNRMTENNLLATAAAAIVQRMMSLSIPLVFRPVSPSKKTAPGFFVSAAMVVGIWELNASCSS